MKQTTVGTIIEENDAQRDAIHVALAPVTSDFKLKPGQRVALVAGSTQKVESVGLKDQTAIGIIDPFLSRTIKPGEKCWLFLFPQTITSLKHNWTHPAFEENEKHNEMEIARIKEESLRAIDPSRIYITQIAQSLDMDYDELMNAARVYQLTGDYLCQGGRFEGVYLPDEFWDHFENVEDKKVQSRGSFFSCSC